MDRCYEVLFYEVAEVPDQELCGLDRIEHIRRFDNLTSAEALFHEVIHKPWCESACVSWGDSILNKYRRLDNETDGGK